MELAFYAAALVAVYSTLRVISTSNPMHALLNLIISLIAVAMIFFCLGAAFAGALQVIVYAGAIMVLFVFVVMMLNLGSEAVTQEGKWFTPRAWLGPSLLSLVLLVEVVWLMHDGSMAAGTLNAAGTEVDVKTVGKALFGPYLLAVELASMLLLGALVAAYHLGRNE